LKRLQEKRKTKGDFIEKEEKKKKITG